MSSTARTLLATPAFLQSLSKLYPSTSPNPYIYIAALVFTAQSKPLEVVSTYEYALSQYKEDKEEGHRMTRIFREALFKTNVLYGAPKMINTLIKLSEVIPEEYKDKNQTFRDPNRSIEDLTEHGSSYFNTTYGLRAEPTRELLETVHPDFMYYCNSLVYGPLYGYNGIISKSLTSLCMVAALIGAECALETRWHMHAALRHGTTYEELKAVTDIAVDVMKALGRGLEEVPEVPREPAT